MLLSDEQPELADVGRPAGRWYSSLGVSTVVHLGLLAALAGLHIGSSTTSPAGALDSRWAPANELVSFETVPTPVEMTSVAATTAGGGQSARLFVDGLASRAASVAVPSTRPLLAADAFGTASSREHAGDSLATVAGGSALPHGSGHGEGEGHGEASGSGGGFFGVRPAGQRFVYVLDCSSSMNQPHDSEARTRFGRLKLELVRSVGTMNPGQQFFIVFFNDHAIPMQARTLQPAVPELQRRYLEWVARFHAVGQTDPREAIALALELRPDVVYLLTDGSFPPGVKRDLLKLRQDRVLIHTFALGNPAAEDMLRAVAEANGGEYHFVP